ncbi:SemiSWEET family transporter [Candidatus Saccharibacteria bacterium]|nr:SemiSWEET family transporter [Candidatus Saccharibacteria bacterium]
MIEAIGFIAGALSLIGYLPQTIKTIRTRKTRDLALATFLFVMLSAALWIVYGWMQNAPSIWVTNSVVMVCCLIITIMKVLDIRQKT